jgi:hypothetical protein
MNSIVRFINAFTDNVIMRFALLALLCTSVLLSSCKGDPVDFEMKSIRADAETVAFQKGRYQFIEAKAPLPGFLLDTATGCMKLVRVIEIGPDTGDVTLSDIKGVTADCARNIPQVPIRFKNQKVDTQ